MDDFTAYGTNFEEAKANLEKVLQRCQDYNLSLNSEKFFMMMEEGVVLGHFISSNDIQVDLEKIEVINTFPSHEKKKDVRRFLRHIGYYRRVIKDFGQIKNPLYNFLKKDFEFSQDVLTKAPVLRGSN